MSVKQELESYKKDLERLQEEHAQISSLLDDLNFEQEPIAEKVEILKNRTSTLAKTLLERTQQELDAINQEITIALKKQANIERDLTETELKISERENSLTFYIQEQANRMVSEFLKYVGEHLEDIGSEITKKYRIIEVTKHQPDRYGSYNIPTGNIGILDSDNTSPIVISSDFYFKNPLYSLHRGDYDIMICKDTEWYEEYRQKFIAIILETLKKNYNYGEFFKLIIDTSGFTLDLM